MVILRIQALVVTPLSLASVDTQLTLDYPVTLDILHTQVSVDLVALLVSRDIVHHQDLVVTVDLLVSVVTQRTQELLVTVVIQVLVALVVTQDFLDTHLQVDFLATVLIVE